MKYSLLILCLVISNSFGFYKPITGTLYQNSTVINGTVGPYDSTWALRTKCNHSYYGVSYWGVTNTLVNLNATHGYKLNYHAVSVVKSNGTNKTWVFDTSRAPAFPNDTANKFVAELFYDETNADNYMYLVHNDSINSKTYIYYMNTATDSMWTQKWVVPYPLTISNQTIRSYKNNLYIIHNDSLYMTNNSIFTSIINNSIQKFTIANDYIWYIYNQSLYRCNLDGSNKITLKTSRLYLDSVYSFAVSPVDTTVYFSLYFKDAHIYHDRNDVKEMFIGFSGISDIFRNVFLDSTGDVWFMQYGVLDTVDIFKIDDSTAKVTRWRYLDGNYPYPPSNDYHRNIFGHYQTTNYNQTFYTGNKFIIKSYNINHASNIGRIPVNDTINYIDAPSKQISYKCTLTVTDDNLSDMHVFYKLTGPSWLTIDTSTVNTHRCVINVNATGVDTGTYNIQARVRDTFYNISNPLFTWDTISWTIKVRHTYQDLLAILSAKDTGWVENGVYACTLAVGDNLTYTSTLPSMMSIDSLTLKTQNKIIVKSRTLTLTDTGNFSSQIIVTNNYNEKDTVNWSYVIKSGKIIIKGKQSLLTKGTIALIKGSFYDVNIILYDYNNSTAYINYANIPSWMNISRIYPKFFRFSGWPTTIGTFTFSVIFTDSATNTAMTFDTINYVITTTNTVVTKTDTAYVGSLYTILTSYTNSSFTDSLDVQYKINSRPSTGIKIDSTYIVGRKVTSNDNIYFNNAKAIPFNDTVIYTRGYQSTGYKISWIPTIADTGNKSIIRQMYLNYTHPFVPETTSSTGIMKRDTVNFYVKYVPELPVNHSVVVANNDTTINLIINDSSIITLNTTDADNDPITYSATKSFITNVNNVFKIKPTAIGTETVYLIATDGQTFDSCKVIVITNERPNNPVVMTNNDTTLLFIIGDSISLTINATDADNDQITYSATKFITVNGNSAKVRPTAIGIDTAYLIVSDTKSYDSCRVIVMVSPKPNNAVVIVNADTSFTLIINDSATITLNATDVDGDPITYSTTASFITVAGNTFKIKPTSTGSDTFWLIASDSKSFDSCKVIVQVNTPPVSIHQRMMPTENGVMQNFPNPFNPVTTINYAVKEPTTVSIEIYNFKGQLVKSLINEKIDAGYHSIAWDAKNVATGSYIYKTRIGEYQKIQKMQLMK